MVTPSSMSRSPANRTRSAGSHTIRSPAVCAAPRQACERIDYHHAVAGHYEAGVWSPFRTAACVTENHVDAGSDLADGETLGEWRENLKQEEPSQMKRMSTDCWNTPPLLSFHTNFSAASRSARN